MMVKWSLNDDVAGWGLSKLIDVGDVTELSMKHANYPDGRNIPIEVSVVLKGARPGTIIEPVVQPQYITASFAQNRMEAPSQTTEAPAAAVAPVATPVPVPPPQSPAPVAEPAAVVSQKRSFDDDDTDTR